MTSETPNASKLRPASSGLQPWRMVAGWPRDMRKIDAGLFKNLAPIQHPGAPTAAQSRSVVSRFIVAATNRLP